jgi:hypothetical protein
VTLFRRPRWRRQREELGLDLGLSGTAGLRIEKHKDALLKNTLSDANVADLDAYLRKDLYATAAYLADIIQVDLGLDEEVKIGVGGLAMDRRPISADLSESEIDHEVIDDAGICLVQVEGLGESVVVDEVEVYVVAESDDGFYTVDVRGDYKV